MNEYYYNNREYILARQKIYNFNNRIKNIKYLKNYWMNKLRFERNQLPILNKQTESKVVDKIEVRFT